MKTFITRIAFTVAAIGLIGVGVQSLYGQRRLTPPPPPPATNPAYVVPPVTNPDFRTQYVP